MAVPKHKTSRARRGQRRAHQALKKPALSVDSTTGQVHRRHHVSEDGFYRGRQVIAETSKKAGEED
jgi:large subunit ribosomal protein L32